MILADSHRFFRGAVLTAVAAFGLVAAEPVLARQPNQPNESFADLVDKLMPTVVNITTTQSMPQQGSRLRDMPQLPPGSPFEELFKEFFDRRGGEEQKRRGTSLGSGFVVDGEGYIVTNNHVIQGAEDITVIFKDDTQLKAKLVGSDSRIDVALLKVEPPNKKPLPAVKWGDSDKERVGDWVIAIGNPFGLGHSVTAGIISARGRSLNDSLDDYLQTDAAINKGNSGGPLFNMDGEVIGINTAILSPSGGSVGIGFAVPSGTASPVIDQLRQFGEVRRGWLGVRIQNVDDAAAEALGLGTARGALIAGIDEKGPAKPAGLEVGDVIVKFDGKDVKDSRELPRIVAGTAVGKDVPIQVMRKGKELNKTVKLARLEDGEKVQQASANKPAGEPAKPVTASALGLEFSAQNDDLRKRYSIKDGLKGVVITKVDANSNAADKRILVGELVVEVGQEPVNSPEDVTKRLDALKKEGKKSALLLVSNAQGEVRFVAVTMS